MKYDVIKNDVGQYFHYKSTNKNKKSTIIFIHGFATTSEYHDVFIKHIIDDFDYISIQLPGAGVQEWTKNKKPTVEDMVDYCVDLIKTMNLDKFIILGHSMGGGIAVRVANIFKDETQVLILSTPMNSRISKLSIMNYFIFNPNTFKKTHRLVNILYHDIINFFDNNEENINNFISSEFDYQITNRKFMTQLKKSMFSIRNMKLGRENEKNISCDTLVIIGKYDKLIPPKSLYKAFGNKHQKEKGIIRLELMNKSAHIPFQEQEIEYAKEIKDFIYFILNK